MTANIHLIVGHYGSGKTEFAVNYALWHRRQGHEVAIADLDIVNPYFRTRQQAQVLGARGISVVSNNMDNDWTVDVPAVSSEINSFFVRKDRENIVDVGGNAVGARVLARYRNMIPESGYEAWLVFNANRYETQNAGQAAGFARDIEGSGKIKLTGVINNTHMLRETEPDDILRGDMVTRELCEMLDLPCIYTVCPRNLEEAMNNKNLLGELFPIDLHLRPEYM